MKADFTSTLSRTESLVILQGIARKCRDRGGEISSYLFSLVEREQWSDLLSFEVPYDTMSLEDVLYSRQILALYQKADFLPLGLDLKKLAVEKFETSESQCRDANSRLRRFREHDSAVFPDGQVVHVLLEASRIAQAVLGPLPSLEDLKLEFGPGATTSTKGSHACPRQKLGDPLACSHELSPWVGQLLAQLPPIASLHAVESTDDSWICNVEVQPGKLMFVPKDAKSLRSIVVEPVLNGLLQKGLGTYMKDRLMRAGLNLFDQGNNQRLAWEGSLNGKFATIDFSMASDTISKEAVFLLLPYDWAEALRSARTGTVALGERLFQLEKFSSMGNAYTFELESLMFWALALATCKVVRCSSTVSVYGDDVVLPTEAVHLYTTVTKFLGFTVNEKKTYRSGGFRESCGADWFFGNNVRPFYQRKLISNQSLFAMHNFFLRNGERELAAYVQELTHPEIRLFGPDGHGDGHLIGDYSLMQSRSIRRNGWEGGKFATWITKARRITKPCPGDAALPVYSVYVRSGADSETDPYVVRGHNGYAKRWIYTLYRGIFR